MDTFNLAIFIHITHIPKFVKVILTLCFLFNETDFSRRVQFKTSESSFEEMAYVPPPPLVEADRSSRSRRVLLKAVSREPLKAQQMARKSAPPLSLLEQLPVISTGKSETDGKYFVLPFDTCTKHYFLLDGFLFSHMHR